MSSNTFVQVPIKSSYVSIGVEIDGDLTYYDVCFINASHKWGILLVSPEGDRLIQLVGFDDSTIEIEDEEYYLNIFRNTERECYEVVFLMKITNE